MITSVVVKQPKFDDDALDAQVYTTGMSHLGRALIYIPSESVGIAISGNKVEFEVSIIAKEIFEEAKKDAVHRCTVKFDRSHMDIIRLYLKFSVLAENTLETASTRNTLGALESSLIIIGKRYFDLAEVK